MRRGHERAEEAEEFGVALEYLDKAKEGRELGLQLNSLVRSVAGMALLEAL